MILAIKNKEKFEDRMGNDVTEFIEEWWNEMNKENPKFKELIYENRTYKKKWLKRIYQAYFELKTYFREETK
jgi:hypothetical protein